MTIKDQKCYLFIQCNCWSWGKVLTCKECLGRGRSTCWEYWSRSWFGLMLETLKTLILQILIIRIGNVRLGQTRSGYVRLGLNSPDSVAILCTCLLSRISPKTAKHKLQESKTLFQRKRFSQKKCRPDLEWLSDWHNQEPYR